MALSGSVLCRVHEYLDMEFVWNAAQDPAANGSVIYWHTLIRAGEWGRIDAVDGAAWSVVIDGHAFSGRNNISIGVNSAKELASGSVFLAHDRFGEKSFDFSFSQYLNITYEDVYIEEVSGSGSAVLDRIDPDVAPVLDKGQVYLGDALNIIPKGPLGATYRLRYAMGGAEGVIAEDTLGAVDWVVPVELGAQIPYTETGTLRILCEAFRDGEPLGRAREGSVTVLVPESAVPRVEEFSWEDVSPAAALGFPVRNVSRLEGHALCAGAMGSQAVRCDMSLGGKPLGLVTEAGELEILVTVTDSRGRVGYHRERISVVDYGPPNVLVSAHRCLEDGTADDTGGWAKITVEPQWTCLGETEPLVWVEMGDEELFREDLTGQMEGKAVGERIAGITLERVVPAQDDRAFAIGGFLTDGLLSCQHGMVLSTAYCVMDVLLGGRGVAFGTVAREPGFLCAMDARFTGKIILPDGSDLMERLGQVVS